MVVTIPPWRSNRIAGDDACRNREGKVRTASKRWREQPTNKFSQAVAREREVAQSVAMECGHWSHGGGSDACWQLHQRCGATEPTGRRARDRCPPLEKYRWYESKSLDERRSVKTTSTSITLTPRQSTQPPLSRRGYATGVYEKTVLKPRPPNHSPPVRLVKAGGDHRKRKHQELQQPMQGEQAEDECEEQEQVEEENVEVEARATGGHEKTVLKPRPPNHSPPLRLVKAGCEHRKRKHQELQQMQGEQAEEQSEEQKQVEDENVVMDAQECGDGQCGVEDQNVEKEDKEGESQQ